MAEPSNPDSSEAGGPTIRSGTGLEPNIAATLSYVLTWITGIIFLMVEKDDYVRFHARQAIVFGVATTVIWIALSLIFPIFIRVFSFMPFLGGPIAALLSVLVWLVWLVLSAGFLIIWIVLMIKAYQGERYVLPVIGEFARKWITGQARPS
jgi:uncharacterized membrane protein